MKIWKNVLYLFILLCIAGSLVNSRHFGNPIYAALFLFTGLVSITALVTFAGYFFFQKGYTYTMPFYAKIFLLLVLYVFLHGLFDNYIGLTHYFWFACGLFICIVNVAVQLPLAGNQSTSRNHSVTLLFWGVAALALAECVLVFLQLSGFLISPNTFFKATGSCVNPNVTAMFLAVSLSATIWLTKNTRHAAWKSLLFVMLVLTIATIGILKCRSAYLVTFILLAAAALPVCRKIYKKQIKPGIGLVAIALIAIALAIAAGMVFVEKKTSALNRIGIWKTSVDMITQKPLKGYGFDAFEKEYNLFAAEKKNPVNDFVNMPYNDFLELGIEGGLPAMLIWIMFLLSVFYFYYKKKDLGFVLPLLLGFITIQLSNFIFQALPVMALLIVYLTAAPYLATPASETVPIKKAKDTQKNIAISVALILAASALAYFIAPVGYGFYQTKHIMQHMQGPASIQAYKSIEKYAKGYAFYHANLGNVYLQENDIQNAKKQYLLALRYNSEENVLDNCGYCYQVEGRYDSSEYYYTALRNMAPHKFGPRYRLLKLFEQTGDTARMLQTAKAIDSMPIKVGGQQVDYIKRYAQLLLQTKNKP